MIGDNAAIENANAGTILRRDCWNRKIAWRNPCRDESIENGLFRQFKLGDNRSVKQSN